MTIGVAVEVEVKKRGVRRESTQSSFIPLRPRLTHPGCKDSSSSQLSVQLLCTYMKKKKMKMKEAR